MAVVSRLESTGKPLSPIMRIAGDSFALYSETPCGQAEAEDLAQWILDYVAANYNLDLGNGPVSAEVGAKVGYAVFEPRSDLSPEEALMRAEEALDDARVIGGSRVERYNPVSSQRQLRAREIERAMPNAIEKGEFFLTYQPQHRLSDGAMIGVEALLRWESAELGAVHPKEFIPIAEANGSIIELGRWALDRATMDAMLLPDDVVMSVNVSGSQMLQGEIDVDVRTALKKSGLPPKRLCLELTETVLVKPTKELIERMHDVRWSGVTWALDDFGTGYSSLSYLSTLPLSKLKLDKSFATNLESDIANVGIVRAAVVLCRGMGLKMLCEGIDADTQVEILHDLGCDEGQGQLFGRPVRMDALLKQLRPDRSA